MKQCNVSIAQFTALSLLYALLESNSKKHLFCLSSPTDDCFADRLQGDSVLCAVVSLGHEVETLL